MTSEISSRGNTYGGALLLGLLGELPGGSAASSVLNASLTRASQERMLRLIRRLEERLSRVEDATQELRNPEVFSAIFNKVALEASQTISDEKIDLLGGLLANSLGWEPTDWRLNQRPLDTLVALPESELRVLLFVSDPRAWMRNNGISLNLTPMGMSYSEFVLKTLCKDDPRLHEDVLFSIEALASKLLIGLFDTDTQMTSEGLFASRKAPLGERVLELGRTAAIA